MEGFRQRLKVRQEEVDSLLCVGLDPLPEKMPYHLASVAGGVTWEQLTDWFTDIVDATAPFASMYKTQRAHYEAMGEKGMIMLWQVINYIKRNYPDILLFLDCKRGDIGRTQKCYGQAHLIMDAADGMNFNPYMGKDCMSALVSDETAGKALVGLCYTSNPAARQIQDLELADGRKLWEFMAETILEWAKALGVLNDAGLVMAAAYENPKGSGNVYAEHLKNCREILGDKLWFLIPGIGTQGGFVEETVKAAFAGYGSIAINSSSGITFASQDADFADAAAGKAEELRDQIRAAM